MRIVLDLQGAQTESRFRGIGRYTLAFAQAIVRNRGEHEVILVLNGYFPETMASICDAFEGLLPTDNVLVWYAPGPIRASLAANAANRRVAQLLREAFLASLQADVIHISSLFEGFVDDAVASIGLLDQRTPVSVSFYDLIPLLNPQQYLTPNAVYEKHYRSQVQALEAASLFLSISDFARSELLATLPVDPKQVVNVSTAAEPVFCQRPIEPNKAMALVKQWGIQKPFLLYAGGADERKNLERLLEAFAALPAPLLEAHQLVLAGKMEAQRQWQLQDTIAALGLRPEQCIFTNYVSDAELVDLYRAAKAFIFPSWHEGFGIPPLEAMCCGVAVIASNSASIPEVVGLPEALFDPFDIANMGERIEQVLSDAPFRARLIAYGLEQAKSFSWDLTAQRAIASFEALHARQEAMGKALPAQSWDQLQSNAEGVRARLAEQLASVLSEEGIWPDDTIAQIARDITRNERAALDFLRLGRLPSSMAWRIEGPFDSSYSLALVNREFARNLEAQGQEVLLHSSEGPGDFAPSPDFLRANPDLIPLHERSLAGYEPRSTGGVIVSRFMYPPRVADMRGRLNLIHGYAWEESGFPPEWVNEFNERLQGISVATEYVKKMLIDNGVHVPIAVTRLGVDHLEHITPHANYAVPAKAFRFLHVSSCFPRKGVEVMLTAFGKAFTRSDDVTLIIKTFPNPHNDARALLAAHQAAAADYPDVVIIEEDLSESELKALYLQCHALLAPSHAEGFGFPMAEAMLAGLAVITTSWSGHVDFCRPDTAWLIDYEFELARTHLNIADSVWAVPDVLDLTRMLREVHALPAAVRSKRAARGRQLLLSEWTWSASTARLIAAARQWALPANRAPLSIAWISSWNSRCGIAKYSEHLLDHFPVAVRVFAPHAHDLVATDTANVARAWHLDGEDDLTQLQEAIHLQGCNCIVIQFNYGFFNFAALTHLIAQQVALGKQIFMTLHATTDPEGHPDKRLHLLLPALAQCTRILVHAVSDLNRLKTLGLVNNVALFPHGILDARQYGIDVPTAPAKRAQPKPGDQQGEVVIASYGFFLPHKGLLELIEAFALLRQHYPRARLRLVNAEYPISISADLIAEAKRAIKALGLADAAELHTEFLSDAQSLQLLQCADVIAFPYQVTGESSSAAVRHGLATGRPVAVTPLAIFDDVGGAAHVLPGFDAKTIAGGLVELLGQLQSGEHQAHAVAQNASIWRKSHQYSAIARRFYGLIRACVIDRQIGR